MNRSENTLRYLAALAAIVGFCMLLGLLVGGSLLIANARLRRDNQQLRVLIQKPVFVQVAAPVYVSPVHVKVSGTCNDVYFDYTEVGGAAAEVNVEGYHGMTMVHLSAGQTAQVTIGGDHNTIHVVAGLEGCVSCTNVGSNSSVVAWR